MSTTFLLRQPLPLSAAMRIDRVPAGWWIALQTAALWPAWRQIAARVADGSGHPLGLLALAALGVLLWLAREQLRCAPRLSWLAAALAGTLAATLLRGPLPPLVTHLLAVLAWACGLLAFLPAARHGAMRARDGVLWPAPRHAIAAAPVLTLALLAWLASEAADPLRVFTAEASRWLPGASVHLLWAGGFTACAAALLKGRADRAFLARLPLAGLAVLAGCVLYRAALVALPTGALARQGVGLLILAAVCGGIAALMSRPTAIESRA